MCWGDDVEGMVIICDSGWWGDIIMIDKIDSEIMLGINKGVKMWI